MAVSNGTTKCVRTTKPARRMNNREFALLCPRTDRDPNRHLTLTLEGMEQLAAAREAMALLSRHVADGALIEAIASDLREAEEKLAEALFDEKPRRAH